PGSPSTPRPTPRPWPSSNAGWRPCEPGTRRCAGTPSDAGRSDRLTRRLPQGPGAVDDRRGVALAAEEVLEVGGPGGVPLDLAAVQLRRAERGHLGVPDGYRAGEAGRGEGVRRRVVRGVEGHAVLGADRLQIALA